MGWVWFLGPLRCKRQATPKKIVKMASSRAGTLLRYFKRGKEDVERKDEENVNTVIPSQQE